MTLGRCVLPGWSQGRRPNWLERRAGQEQGSLMGPAERAQAISAPLHREATPPAPPVAREPQSCPLAADLPGS